MSDLAPPGSSLLIRLLVLAALLAAINAWCIRHLGQDLAKLGFLNATAVAFGFLFSLLREREQRLVAGERERRTRGLVDRLLDPAVLAALAIVFAVAGSFVSSVTVLADGVGGARSVHLTPEGRTRDEDSARQLADASAAVRYLRLTTPFGRPFYAEVEGYLRHSFDLHPWTGATLRVGRDLRPTPAVLVRVPLEWFALLGHSRLRASVDDRSFEIATAAGRGAVFLGRAEAISGERLADWRRALVAARQEEPEIELALLSWKKPLLLRELPALSPGAELVLELLIDARTITGVRYTVTSDGFQDVELPREWEETP